MATVDRTRRHIVRLCSSQKPQNKAAEGFFGPAHKSAYGTKRTSRAFSCLSASLIGRLGQALSDYPPLQCRCRPRARASLRTRHKALPSWGFEDEVEQSFGRPRRQHDGRSKRTNDLTSSIVP